MRSALQKAQFRQAKKLRHQVQVYTKHASSYKFSTKQYCIAVLSEGMGETQARRFLSKLNIQPPSPTAFFKAQQKILPDLEKITNDSMKKVREYLPAGSIFGVDCSWSARRNAQHAILVFMEMKSKLIFDKVIISKNPEVSDIPFNGTSNLMENAAIEAKKHYYMSNYKFVGFIHDFDVDTAPALMPDPYLGQLVELLDPGHLKKVLENVFHKHNTENHLYQLKHHIVSRFSFICNNRTLSMEDKIKLWYTTPDWIINNQKIEKKGYLVSKGGTRRYSPEVAKAALTLFLSETEWLIRKCSVSSTNPIEAFNAEKSRFSPKHLSFQRSFKVRCLMAILKWNDPLNWYDILMDTIVKREIDKTCATILSQAREKRRKARSKSKQTNSKIMRNIKRRNARMLNRIDPKGHQYASDVKMKEIKERYTKEEKDQALPNNPRKDPYRYTALEFLPAISNINSNNCFINAVLQLLKNTNISVNFSFYSGHPLVQVMIKLNNGESISADEINQIRKNWNFPLSTCGMEDASEFYYFFMNEIFDMVKIATDRTLDALLSRTPFRSIGNAFYNSYVVVMKTSIKCPKCNNITVNRSHEFLLPISLTSNSLLTNIEDYLNSRADGLCEKCKQNVTFAITNDIEQCPNFLWLHLKRFRYDEANKKTVKNDNEISIPQRLRKEIFGEEYDLSGIVYHLGDSSSSGHYISKYVSIEHNGSIETYDDDRCYRNAAEKKLLLNHSYMILYKKRTYSLSTFKPVYVHTNLREAYEILQAAKEELKQKNAVKKIKGNDKQAKSEANTEDKLFVNFSKKIQTNTEKIRELVGKFSYLCSLHSYDASKEIT